MARVNVTFEVQIVAQQDLEFKIQYFLSNMSNFVKISV